MDQIDKLKTWVVQPPCTNSIFALSYNMWIVFQEEKHYAYPLQTIALMVSVGVALFAS